MQQKNYYQILGVTPSANQSEIKAAFRRLALIYHPDKNLADEDSNYIFQEINEAYQVLSDRAARADYHRDFEMAGRNFKKEGTVFFSAELLLVKLGHMNKALLETDPYRMNTDAVFEELQQLFSAYHLQLLQKEENEPLFEKITKSCLEILVYLPKTEQLQLLEDLKRLPSVPKETLEAYTKKQSQKWFWDQFKIPLVFLIVVLLCLLIFWVIG